jgi:hypothetical protein
MNDDDDDITSTTSISSSSNNNNNNKSDQRNTDFAYQEMKVLLRTCQKENIVASNRMDPSKAQELNQYIQDIVQYRTSSSGSSTSSGSGTSGSSSIPSVEELYHTTWNLVYTTMDYIPRDVTIQFTLWNERPSYQEEEDGSHDRDPLPPREGGTVQYRLLFGAQTFGWESININGDWAIQQEHQQQQQQQLLMTYRTWSLDAFGFQNVHVCLLQNLFQGRTRMIHTVYYDGTIWIEKEEQQQEEEQQLQSTNTIWNVYMRKQT